MRLCCHKKTGKISRVLSRSYKDFTLFHNLPNFDSVKLRTSLHEDFAPERLPLLPLNQVLTEVDFNLSIGKYQ